MHYRCSSTFTQRYHHNDDIQRLGKPLDLHITTHSQTHCALFTCLPNTHYFFSAYGADLHCHLLPDQKKDRIHNACMKTVTLLLWVWVWWGCAFINPRSKFRGTSCVWQHQWEHSDKEQTNYSQEILTQRWLLTFCVYISFSNFPFILQNCALLNHNP